jgi:mono/diheme cytochrome c family protein
MQILFAVCVLSLLGCMVPSADAQMCASDSLETAGAGKSLYRGKGVCASCHGEAGKGNGDPQYIELMNPKPSDLNNDAGLKHRTTEARYTAIRDGVPKTAMPAYRGQLTEEEIKLITEYLELLHTGQC